MNKREARRRALYDVFTVGQLRSLIASARESKALSGPSSVNKSITKEQALDIFDAALGGYEDGHVMEARIDVLTITNILREAS